MQVIALPPAKPTETWEYTQGRMSVTSYQVVYPGECKDNKQSTLALVPKDTSKDLQMQASKNVDLVNWPPAINIA
jgi:hypothetical protein